MKTHSILASRVLLIALIPLIFSCSRQKSTDYPPFPSGHEEKLEWWKDARFGMFIHWGPVSLKGTEIGWSRGQEIPVGEYDSLYLKFNPVNFNASEWVKLAKDAGMNYMVFTSKHHDGFCNWATEYTDYNIMNSAYGKDIMAQLSAACKEQGLALGFYHSTCDWHHPDFPLTSPGGRVEREEYNLDRYTEYLKNQSVEIISKYGPLLVMWYDVPQRFDSVRGQGVIDHIREIQPGILVNNRSGAPGDFDTPEQRIGGFNTDRPWETCMTIGRQWAWKPNDEVKSLEQCLHGLIRSAGGDGNLLFNVGPKPDGTIEPLQAQRLREMGQWLKEYGYSIYGTRGGPFKPTDWGVSTRKGDKIYLHILRWQGDNPQIRIPDTGMEIKACRLVTGGDVELEKQEEGYLVKFAADDIQQINTIIELTVGGDAMAIAPMEIAAQSLSYNKPVKASTNPDPRWRGANSVNNGEWVGHYWTPGTDDKTPWLEIDLEKPEKISKFILFESGQAINEFKIQYLQDDAWETAYTGKEVENGKALVFSEITAQKVRLLLTGFSSVPGIFEIIIL
ncbi:MAG: alpha-L-fucosidase [Bacteroidales bacterium]|nr:alpha-L-fucosidase [Bacteroidales bacterium]